MEKNFLRSADSSQNAIDVPTSLRRYRESLVSVLCFDESKFNSYVFTILFETSIVQSVPISFSTRHGFGACYITHD